MLNIPENKKEEFRKKSIFKNVREIFAYTRQMRQIKAAHLAVKNNLACLKTVTDFTLILKHLDETENILNKAKLSINQTRERSKRVFPETSSQDQRDEIIAESQLEDTVGYISGLKLLVKILIENKTQEGVLEKMGDLITWFGFDGPQVELFVTEEVIEQKKWKTITMKDAAKCRPWDDMLANIRRRHQGIREIFERAGGKFYYQVTPLEGTKVILMMPHFEDKS